MIDQEGLTNQGKVWNQSTISPESSLGLTFSVRPLVPDKRAYQCEILHRFMRADWILT